MAQTLPLSSIDTSYSFITSLDGLSFEFVVNWNERDSGWFISINDADGIAILSGVKLVVGGELLHLTPDILRRPRGLLIVLDTDGSGVDPGRNDLGERVVLVFVPLDEL